MASPDPLPAGAVLQELRGFRELGSVLYIAAHPDDENTRLIAFLARGPGYRTGYLSLTRGDGGQNLIGTELRDSLGVIRTQELLAARRIDGGRQFFSRANDFGFSKDYKETLAIWDRKQVLEDTVRVIRLFQPDVVITRFSPEPGKTHGHHTASAILALEAVKLAADPAAFSGELGTVPPWKVKRVLWNVGANHTPDENAPLLTLDVGGYNPLLGESFGEIAARSRTMHKSQGFGILSSRGAAQERFQLLAGEPATTGILDGVETDWGRFGGGGAEIGRLTDEAIAKFNPGDPAASVPALLEIRSRLAALPGSGDGVVADKRRQLDRVLFACLGLYWETVVPGAEVLPGETLKLRYSAIARNAFPVRWAGVVHLNLMSPHLPEGTIDGWADEEKTAIDLPVNRVVTRETTRVLPANTPLTQPYWLREPGTTGMFTVNDSALIGRPESPPAFPVQYVFEVGGQTLVAADEPVQVIDDPVKGEIRRQLQVVAPVALRFPQPLELFAPGETRSVTAEVTAARANAGGTVKLETPPDWRVSPSSQKFDLKEAGETARFVFKVTAPDRPSQADLGAVAEIGGAPYRSQRVEIEHGHIPPQLLQPPARLKAVSLDLHIRGRKIGYLPGAGDLVAESLTRMGYEVTLLGDADLMADRLREFDAVVLGVRAFNTRPDLVRRMPALFAYAKGGGNVIVQYNTTADLPAGKLAPYDFTVSRDRVTDERAPVTLLAPDHPALNTPNKITPADFDGWVQERGLYFANRWAPDFTAPLASGDPGEAPLSGGLLVAKYGRGYFVYTGYSWFRQLPEGVPGAYRLFANLVSLGK